MIPNFLCDRQFWEFAIKFNIQLLGGILVLMLAYCVGCLLFAGIDRIKNLSKRKPKENHPQVIVVGNGPPKHSAYDILTKPTPMPKWKLVENILTPVVIPGFNHIEDIATPKLTNTINNKDIKLKKPKTADRPKRRNRAQCKKSSHP